MAPKQAEALDHKLTTPPRSCDEDGHSWRHIGRDGDGTDYYKCRHCGQENEE
ncbi:hypothetical protein [Pseudomonas sp.]|uniref:hypothetical protein n=1 Tax=Pseudomonas sp. TaxID=306 RepID=UPI002586207B|nr:hypothetical protein [Pseudomonas sp.]